MVRVFLPALAAVVFLSDPALGQALDLDPESAVETQIETPADDPEGGAATPEAAAAAAAAADADAGAPPAPAQPARAAAAAPAPVVPPTFVLREVSFANTSRLLDAATLRAAVSRLTGQRYLRRDAGVIAEALTELYTARGFGFSRVVLQAVNPAAGSVTVAFYEPVVGEVRGGSAAMSPDYVRYRMNLPEGALADRARVSERVERLGVTDGLTLTYTPVDTGQGAVDILVNVPEVPRHQTTLSLDTYGSPAYGRAQLTLNHRINGLFGRNDPLVLGAILRQGVKSVSLDYSTPVTPDGARFSLGLLGSESASLDAPSVNGSVRSATAGLALPLIARNDLRFSLTTSVAIFGERATLLGVPTLDQIGRELTLGAAGQTSGEGWTFSGSVKLAAGTYDDAVAATTGNAYAAVSGEASFTTLLGEALFGSISVQAQRSILGAQPSQRSFTVTAPYAVRGYPTGLAVGDSGYAVRLQLETTEAFDLGDGLAVRPFVFGDIGEAFDSTDTGLGLAASIGAGLSLGSADGRLSGDIFLARPITTAITGWTTPSTRPVIAGAISVTF